MRHRIRPAGEFRRDHGVERDHVRALPVLGAHVNLGEIAGTHPVLRVRLGLDAIDPAEFEEVVDVEVAEIGLQGVEDVGDGNSQRLGSLPVDVRVEPRRADAKVGADRPDGRVLPGLREELLDDGRELLEVASARVLHLHGEAAGGAQAPDRRGVEGEDKRLRDLQKFPEGASDDRLDVLVGARAFVPEMQGRKQGR